MAITAQLHDGTRIEFPDGTDPSVIQRTVQNVLGKQAPQAPAGTNPTQLKGSSAGGMFMGLRDAVDAGAQMLVHALPESVVGTGNQLNNRLADMGVPGISKLELSQDGGTLSGLVSGSKQGAAGPLDRMVSKANAEYDASRQLAGRDGVDLARIGGNLLNPVNRVVPMSGATSTIGVVGRAALQGGISGAAQPITDTSAGDFAQQKAAQTFVGAAGGAVGGYVGDKVIGALGNKFAALREKPGFPVLLGGNQPGMPIAAQTEKALGEAAGSQGIDLTAIPKAILDDVRGQVQSALQKGKKLDVNALVRVAESRSVLGSDAGLMTGQATRDPQLFARELDLRGIQGAGKPIADRLATQNTRLIEAVGKRGASSAPDAYDAGATAIKSLQDLDSKLSADVGAAYTKFRNASGSSINVPMQPIAQRLGEVLDTYGSENLPAAVLSKFKSYGLTGDKQTKAFDLLEADKLIKIINANYDPMKASQAGALSALRKGLSESIDLADSQTQGATGPAADLLREALGKAKSRFALHEAVPALEAAAKDPGAQEAFVRRYITSQSAGVDSVAGVVKLLSPEAADAVKRNVLASILEKAAPGAIRGSDTAKFSQDGYRKALDAIGDRKLKLLFGDDGVSQLRQIARVSEWIQKQPVGSAVNNSNSAAQVMNLLQGVAGKSSSPTLNKLGSLPGVNLLKNSLAQSLDESAARNALAANIPQQSAQLAPEEVNALRRFLPITGGAFGSAFSGGLR